LSGPEGDNGEERARALLASSADKGRPSLNGSRMVSGNRTGTQGKQVVAERPIEFRGSRGARELSEAGRRASNTESLGCPHTLGGRGGQEGAPVISLGLPDGLEVGGSRRPCGREECGIETVPFRGAPSGVIGLPEHR